MLLTNIKGTTPDAELKTEYDELKEQANNLLSKLNIIMEAPMGQMSDQLAGQDAPPQEMGGTEQRMPAPGQVAPDDNMEEIMAGMEQVMKQMDAAKRGLGMVNTLGDGPSRTRNRSRLMGNMNRIRGNLRRLEKMIASSMENDQEVH